MSIRSYPCESLSKVDRHQLIIGSVSPRPIALVSSIDKNGISNLAPYSFFTAISSSPPILVFSVSKPPGPREQKDTILNLREVPECVINIVDDKIARQMSLCSVEFEHGVSEFDKSGLAALPSKNIKPLRVKSSPVQFECTVRDILVFGNEPGSSNLVICDVLEIHVNENIMTKEKIRIDSGEINTVGRLGRSDYVKVDLSNIFTMYQNVKNPIIGFDKLPRHVLQSRLLSARDLAELASCEKLPGSEEIQVFINKNPQYQKADLPELHKAALLLIKENKKEEALLCLSIPDLRSGKI